MTIYREKLVRGFGTMYSSRAVWKPRDGELEENLQVKKVKRLT